MALRVEVSGFSGAWAVVNAAPTVFPVGIAELVNRAITVGGAVEGSAFAKSRRRSSIADMVLGAVNAAGPPTVATPLQTTTMYAAMETSEKTGVSFRLGMALASIVASRVLDVPALKHVADLNIKGGGRRADLFGLDKSGNNHVVEAKARTYGVTPQVMLSGKQQALATQLALPPSMAASTASVSLADLSTTPIAVQLHDPPPPQGRLEPLDEQRYQREFYEPVPELLEIRAPMPSGYDAVDEVATGSWLPGADVWLGLRDSTRAQLDSPLGPSPLRTAGPLEIDDGSVDPWLVYEAPDGHVVVLGPDALRATTG